MASVVSASSASSTPATIATLARTMDAMATQITELNGRLETALDLLRANTGAARGGAGGAPEGAATTAAVEAPKGKAAKAAKSAKAPKEKAEKAEKEAKEKKEKKVCPPAAEGVVRFSSSAGTSPHRLFSPLFKQSFTVAGKEFPTVEHYAQYIKFATTDAEFAESLLEKAPATLRMAGGSKKHEADPEYSIEAAYRAAYTAAIAENEDLKAALLATADAAIEAEYPTDAVLGIGEDGTGQNLLGTILMALRITVRA